MIETLANSSEKSNRTYSTSKYSNKAVVLKLS